MAKSRSMIIYGESGDTKTSQLYHLAKYIIKKTGKKLRLISADGGGYSPFEDPSPDPFFKGKSLIESGWVEAFDISYRQYALADMRRLAEGYWPRKYKGDLQGYFKNEERCLTTPEEWEGLAGYLIEGITSISKLLLNHIADQDGAVGFKKSFEYDEEGYKISGLQEGHYGIVQKEIYKIQVHGFGRLPIDWCIWTALVAKGTDKRTGTKVFGPKSAGDATTFEIPSWFMDCMHLSQETITSAEGKGVVKKVAWFRQHNDIELDIPYLCKARISPELYPKLLELYPNGYVTLGYKQGLNKYLEALDKIKSDVAITNNITETEKVNKEQK